MGKWVNRDPIGEFGGISLYLFVLNRSIDRHDSLGLSWETRTPVRNRFDAEDFEAAMGQRGDFHASRSTWWEQRGPRDENIDEVDDSRCSSCKRYVCKVTKTKEFMGAGRILYAEWNWAFSKADERDYQFWNAWQSRAWEHEQGHIDISKAFVNGVGEVTHSQSRELCDNAFVACELAAVDVDLWFISEKGRLDYRLTGQHEQYDVSETPILQQFYNDLMSAYGSEKDVP